MEAFELGGKSSLTIVLDRTGSMGPVMEALQKFLPMYLIRRWAKDLDQLSLVTFDDHYRSETTRALIQGSHPNLRVGPAVDVLGSTSNLEEYVYWLQSVRLGDGDDPAEAIACALAAARAVDPHGQIWLVTDAVPHGSGGIVGDDFPRGCPCGTPLDVSGVSVLFARTLNSVEEEVRFWQDTCPRNLVIVDDLATHLQGMPREMVAA